MTELKNIKHENPKQTEKEMGKEQHKQHHKHVDNQSTEKIKELTNLLQRLQAEFENYKKRIERDQVQYKNTCQRDLLIKLLSIVDTFELAFKNTTNTVEFTKGMELIFSQLKSLLEQEGITTLEHKKQFDPVLHEALLQADSEEPSGTILEEFQKGYLLHGQILRHAKVKVANQINKENPTRENGTE